MAMGVQNVVSDDSFAKFREEAQNLGITVQAKLSEYLQCWMKEVNGDRLITQRYEQKTLVKLRLCSCQTEQQ